MSLSPLHPPHPVWLTREGGGLEGGEGVKHSTLNPTLKPANIPLERLASNKHLTDPQKVTELARQFEAVLLRQILGEAHKKVFTSTMNPDSMTGGVYQDMITNQLADQISHAGSFGLARALEAQLQQELKTETPSVDGPSTP